MNTKAENLHCGLTLIDVWQMLGDEEQKFKKKQNSSI